MDQIWNSIDWEWKHHPQPEAKAIERATELLRATEGTDLFPDSASSGRFPTVRFFWKEGNLEVEVFADRYEFYEFYRAKGNEDWRLSEFDAARAGVMATLKARIRKALAATEDGERT